MQGRDDGTFSSEAGGMIKAYGNAMINCIDLITYSENKTSFDYYDASSRDERVPSSVVALKGGSTYSNFDTDSDMYTYNVQTPEAAMESVKALSGRVQGGDFKWTFTDKDNTDYDVNTALKSALVNYKTSLVSVGGVESNGVEIPEGGNNGVDIPEITGGIVHNFTTSGKDSQFFQIEGNLSTSKGTVTYDGLTLTQCLKMETSTSITFTLSTPGTMILVIGGSGSKNEWRVDVDGVDHQNIIPEGAQNYMLCIVELEAGAHTITKKDSTNLYYIVIEQSSETDSSAE
jgi:pectate lyase